MLSALYFPALRPDPAWVDRLSTFIDRLVCYGAVEGDEPVSGCEVRVPSPLGSDRSRFLALLRELTGREAEQFKGRLLAPAPRGGRDRDETSGWGLTAALHRGGSVEAEQKRAREERLWQARLVLKLAETVAASEAEITRQLAAVTRQQAEMLRALQGEGDAEDSLPLPSLEDVRRTSFRVRELLGAWAVFFREDPNPEPFLVTDNLEAGDLLLEEVENLEAGGIIRLPDLLLPGATAATDGVRAALAQALSGGDAENKKQARPALLAAVTAWNASLAAAGETEPYLRLYLLPGGPVRRVLGALSGLSGESGPPTASPMLLGISICKG